MTVVDKQFIGRVDRMIAERAKAFIDDQRHGAGTWPDEATVRVPRTCNTRLMVLDKVGSEQGPMERWVGVRRGDRLIVTFVYNHHTHALIRTF